jgi:hypothetical protein
LDVIRDISPSDYSFIFTNELNEGVADDAKLFAEVEELVPAGELDPDMIHTPGIYVNRIFKGENYEKRIEQITTRAK